MALIETLLNYLAAALMASPVLILLALLAVLLLAAVVLALVQLRDWYDAVVDAIQARSNKPPHHIL